MEGWQLVVRVGQHLDERYRRPGKRADHNPGQDENKDISATTQGARQRTDGNHREKAAAKAEELDGGDGEPEQNTQHGAETGARRYAKNIRDTSGLRNRL
jgi:hypothetical protein